MKDERPSAREGSESLETIMKRIRIVIFLSID